MLVGVLVAWSRKSGLGPAEIALFVFLVLFKDGGRRVSLRFHLFVSDVNQGNELLTSRSFYLKLWYSCSKSKSYSEHGRASETLCENKISSHQQLTNRLKGAHADAHPTLNTTS